MDVGCGDPCFEGLVGGAVGLCQQGVGLGVLGAVTCEGPRRSVQSGTGPAYEVVSH